MYYIIVMYKCVIMLCIMLCYVICYVMYCL